MSCRSGLPDFLGANIRHLRRGKGWSQEELARQTGLTRGRIASYESGCAEPPLRSLFSLAEVLEVSVWDLVCTDLQRGEPVAPEKRFSFSAILTNQARIQALQQEALELEKVIEGLFKCHCYKVNNLRNVPDDLMGLRHDFEQLHSMSCRLLDIHKEIMSLMSFVQAPVEQEEGGA